MSSHERVTLPRSVVPIAVGHCLWHAPQARAQTWQAAAVTRRYVCSVPRKTRLRAVILSWGSGGSPCGLVTLVESPCLLVGGALNWP